MYDWQQKKATPVEVTGTRRGGGGGGAIAVYDWQQKQKNTTKGGSDDEAPPVSVTEHSSMDDSSQFGESVRRLTAVGIIGGTDAEKMLDTSYRSSIRRSLSVKKDDMDNLKGSSHHLRRNLRKVPSKQDTRQQQSDLDKGGSTHSLGQFHSCHSKSEDLDDSFNASTSSFGLDLDDSEDEANDNKEEKKEEPTMNWGNWKSALAPSAEEQPLDDKRKGSSHSLGGGGLAFHSCHSISAGLMDSSNNSHSSTSSFGVDYLSECGEDNSDMDVSERCDEYALHKSGSLLSCVEDQAARKIQRFFRNMMDWYRQETQRLEAEKKDVFRRQEEELETVQRLLETEKQRAQLEIEELEEDARLGITTEKCEMTNNHPGSFDWNYFTSLKDHRNELRQLGTTRGFQELRESIDHLTRQNKEFEGLVDLGKRAMVRAKEEVAKVEASLEKEKARTGKLHDCIMKITDMCKAHKDAKLAAKVQKRVHQGYGMLPDNHTKKSLSRMKSLPVDVSKDSLLLTVSNKTKTKKSSSADDGLFLSTAGRANSTPLFSLIEDDESSKEDSPEDIPKLHRRHSEVVRRNKGKEVKRKSLRRQRSKSYSDINEAANDPAPLLSLILEESKHDNDDIGSSRRREGRQSKKPLRRQRSKSSNDAEQPKIKAKEGKRKSLRRLRSKSFSDLNESAANEDPAPLLSLIEMKKSDRNTGALRRMTSVSCVSSSGTSDRNTGALRRMTSASCVSSSGTSSDPAPLLSLIEMKKSDHNTGALRRMTSCSSHVGSTSGPKMTSRADDDSETSGTEAAEKTTPDPAPATMESMAARRRSSALLRQRVSDMLLKGQETVKKREIEAFSPFKRTPTK